MGNGQLIVPGTAVPADVRASKKFSSGPYYGAQGGMPEYSGTKYTPTAAGILIPAGYHDGTTGTTAEPNLVAANILSGISIFGVVGSASGRQFASGTATSSAGTSGYNTVTGSSASFYSLVVSGLTFQPTTIIVYHESATPASEVVTFISGAQFGGSQGQIFMTSSTPSTTPMDLAGAASVTATGFNMPVRNASNSYKWQAWA